MIGALAFKVGSLTSTTALHHAFSIPVSETLVMEAPTLEFGD